MSAPTVLYHGTAATNVPGILSRGLVPRGAKGADAYAVNKLGWNKARVEGREPSVFVTPDERNALWYARIAAKENNSKPVVLKVTLTAEMASKLIEDEFGDHTPEWGARYPGAIPRECVVGEVPADELKLIGLDVPPAPTARDNALARVNAILDSIMAGR